MTTDIVDDTPSNPFDNLTSREKQVATFLCDGLRNAEIAEKLDISTKTVDTHRGHLLAKLSCRNNVELVRLAIRHGFVTV